MSLRLIVFTCTFFSFAFADALYLKSGAVIHGSYAGGDTRQVKIMTGDHVETYAIDEVLRLEFGSSPASGTPQFREQGLRPPDQDRPAPPPAFDGIEIPVGTNLVIRLIEGVDSERDSVGQKYRASLDEPVIVNGQTVIPRGADCVAKLVEDKEAGKFTGKTVLTLALESVMVNARMMDVRTSEVTRASGSQTAKTAKTVGGGAVGGAVLGGIFGGGTGAAIGAASGGALGLGVDVMTKGQKVKIPSETRLSFLLQQPLRV
jgi:hypothetical protein